MKKILAKAYNLCISEEVNEGKTARAMTAMLKYAAKHPMSLLSLTKHEQEFFQIVKNNAS